MSHDNREEVKIYQKHNKEIRHHIAKELLDVIDIEFMKEAVVWKMICDCGKNNIPREYRRDYIIKEINKEMDKWI